MSICASAGTGRRPTPGPVVPLPARRRSFARAANRCVGVGKCRQHTNKGGAVMCPSYQVTHEEEHSTRGRAGLLFEMLNGHGDSPIGDGWRSDAVRDALDLCLACKGCRNDCPANVDMATYKAEFLAHHWRGANGGAHARPVAGLAAGVAARCPACGWARIVNALTHAPALHRAAGVGRRGRAARRCRCSRAPPFSAGTPLAARAGTGGWARSCCGRTPSATTCTRTSGRRRSMC